jgi:hypothetical protein
MNDQPGIVAKLLPAFAKATHGATFLEEHVGLCSQEAPIRHSARHGV